MSKTIDERVVEMRFDNKQFESNVATSMSTLDKLKQKLNFSGASKGLEEVNSAAGKVNMSGLGDAVDTVKAKFSALDVVAVTALANITNQAVNAGKHLLASLSVDQITSGWQKYADKTTSVATLQAQGYALEEINSQLDLLNWFTDETSYNFTDMVSNISKFTATGKGLTESVNAMEGIATWAALSGQNAVKASSAMYQLSQALSAGFMRKEDWKSIQNVSMDTDEFRQKTLEAAVALKTLKDNGDGTYTSLINKSKEATNFTKTQFVESLTTGAWFTSDVMRKVFSEYSSAVGAIYKITEEKGMLAVEVIDEIHSKADTLKTDAMSDSEAIDAAIRDLGYTLEDGSLMFDSFGLKAFEAGQKARTFRDAIDSVKDAVSTGWMKTFEIIFGDAEKATELWTDLANTLWDIFAAGGEVRNTILKFALNFSKPWNSITEKLENVKLGKIKEVSETFKSIEEKVDNAAQKLEYFQNIVNKVWRGDYGTADTGRFQKLEDEGYNSKVVQDLVNKGYGYKLTVDDINESYKKFGLTVEETTEQTKKETKATEDSKIAFEELTDAQLEQAGLSEEEISLYRALEKESKKLGISISDLAKEMSEVDGRTLLIDSFKNALDGLLGIAKAMKGAFSEIFEVPSIGEMSIKLYGLLKRFNEFSEKLRLTDKETGKLNENGQKLQRTFKGIFAIVDMVATVVGGALRIAFKVVSQVLDYFNINILDVTAAIGDVLVKVHDWFESIFDISGALDKVVPVIKDVIDAIREWYSVFKETPAVQKLIDAIEGIRTAFQKLFSGKINIAEFAASLGESLGRVLRSLPGIAIQVGKDFIAGFQNGIGDSISGVISNIINFCKNFVSAFASALGVHSPSWKAEEIACDFFQGFINGAKKVFSKVIDVLKKIGEEIVKVFKSFWDFITDESGNIEWDKIFIGASIISGIILLKKLLDNFSKIANAFDGIGNILNSVAGSLKSFSKVLDSIALDYRAKAIQKMVIAIAILVASIWVLCQIDDYGKMWNAVAIIVVLAGVLFGLSFALKMLGSASIEVDGQAKTLNAKGIQSAVIQIGLAILAIAAAVKIIGSMSEQEAIQGFLGLAGIVSGMVIFLAVLGGITKYSGDLNAAGKFIKKMAITMLLMVLVCKLAGNLDAGEMIKGAVFATGFAIFVRALVKATNVAGNDIAKVGSLMIGLSIAMLLMAGVCKLAGTLDAEDMINGGAFATAFVFFVRALVKVTTIGKDSQIAKISGLVLSISVSLLLMAGVCKLIGLLSVGDMIKGALFVAGFIVMLRHLVGILTIANEQKIAKISAAIISMSIAIGILAGVSVALSFIDIPSLAKGITAVGLLSIMMANMIRGLKGAQNIKGTMTSMAIAIGIMAGAVIALSFVDTNKLIPAVLAMSMMMGMFALMTNSLRGIGKESIKAAGAALGLVIVLAGIAIVLVAVINEFKGIDTKNAITTVACMIALMSAMAGLLKLLLLMKVTDVTEAFKASFALATMVIPLAAFCFALSKIKVADVSVKTVGCLIALMSAMAGLLFVLKAVDIGNVKGLANVGAGIGALASMVIPMLVFIAALKQLNGVENVIENVKALVLLIGAMTLLLLPLMGAGALIGPSMLGIIALTALIVPIKAFIYGLKKLNKVKDAEKNIDLLIGLMTKFTDILVKISLVGPLAIIGASAMYGLTLLMSSIGTMAVIIGGIIDKIPKIKIFLDKGLPVLEEIFTSMGRMLGGFVNGLSEGLSSGLVKMGAGIELFTGSIAAAASNISGIDTSFFSTVKDLFILLGELGTLSITTSIGDLFSKLFSGQTSIEKFGNDSVEFFNAMKKIGEASSGITIDSESFGIIIEAAKDLAELEGSLKPMDGVIQWFAGTQSLGDFGESISQFIQSMITAFSNIEGITYDKEAFDSIMDAATQLCNLEGKLTPIDGVVQWFMGTQSLGNFGESINSFVVSMKTAMATLNGTSIDEVALDSIIAAAIKLSDLQKNSLEPIDGVVQWFKGAKDLGTFGETLVPFTNGMNKLSKCGKIKLDTLESLIEATKKLNPLQEELNSVGGIPDFFTGRSDIGAFGENLILYAKGMQGLSECGTIDETVVENLVTVTKTLSECEDKINFNGGFFAFIFGEQNLGIFGTNVGSFADGMKKLSKVGPINTDNVESLVTAAGELAGLESELENLGGLVSLITGNQDLETFGEHVGSFIDNMVTALSGLDDFTYDSEAFSNLKTAAEELSGLESGLKKLGGLVSLIKGNQNLQEFGEHVDSFISNMKSAFANLNGFTYDSEAFGKLKTATEDLSGLEEKLTPVGGVIQWFVGNKDLGTFGENIKTFSEGIKSLTECEGLDSKKISSITTACEELQEFEEGLKTGVQSILDWFIGNETLGDFGVNVGLFAEGMMKLKDCEGLKEETIGSIISAAGKLQELKDKLDTDATSLMEWFINNSSIGSFGVNVGLFAEGMIKLKDCEGLDSEVIGSLIDACGELQKLEGELKSGAQVFIDWFTGKEDLDDFSSKVGIFAEAMGKLKSGVGDNGITDKTIESISKTGEAIIELQKSLPTESWFDGKMDLTDFSGYIEDFGTAMSAFGDAASSIDIENVSKVINTAYRIKNLITSLSDLKTTGLEVFTGIGTGGPGADGAAYEIAKTISEFSEEVSEIDIGLVSSSITAAIQLKKLIVDLSGLDPSGINNFKIGQIGFVLKSYGNYVDDLNMTEISNSIDIAIRLKDFISSLSGFNTSGIGAFKTAITKLNTVNISNLVKVFSGASSKLASSGSDMISGLIRGIQSMIPAAKSSVSSLISSINSTLRSRMQVFTNAGQTIITRLVSGISNNKTIVSSSVSSLLSSAVANIRNKYTSFYSAGSYLVEGFCKGIRNNGILATGAVRDIINEAIRQGKIILKINSPSKVFEAMGAYVAEGFANGIKSGDEMVKRSSSVMASIAISETKKTMGTILNILSSDMDSQPTIRPVIDLSDVKTGVNAISGMFADTKTIGVQSNLNAINTAMNRKLQNRNNDDIISAINKLSDGLESNRGDTYNFGDITYDDGSGISDAVQMIVRAARMGKRV